MLSWDTPKKTASVAVQRPDPKTPKEELKEEPLPKTEPPPKARIKQLQDREEEKQQVEQEVRRQLEAKRQERESRLVALTQRVRAEIPPLEADVRKDQLQLEDLDKNMDRFRAMWLRPGIQSFGNPTGS